MKNRGHVPGAGPIFFFKKGDAWDRRDKPGGKVKILELFHVYSCYKGIFTITKIHEIYMS